MTDILENPTLEADITRQVPVIQDLFVSVLEAYCEHEDAGITAICERLGIHRKLAWQIRNVAYSTDPFRAVRFMPPRASIEALIASLNARGLSGETADRLRESMNAFERIIEFHAGDRKSFEMLVESCAPEPEESVDVKWREKAFEGNSFIWGVRAKTQLSTSILKFSDDKPEWFDLVQVRGLIGFKRVRPNVYWIVGQSVVRDGDEPGRVPQRVPIDSDGATRAGGVPLLPDFCSQPLPELRRRPTDDGLLNDELVPGPVGFAGQQTVVTGEIVRELSPIHATTENKRVLFGAVVRTPSEVFVYDQFVHRDLFPGVERELCVFSELNSPVAQSDEELLPVTESIEHLGRGLGAARTRDVPGYLDMLRSIFAGLELNSQDFDLYRVRMEFPPMPASVVIRHPLATRD